MKTFVTFYQTKPITGNIYSQQTVYFLFSFFLLLLLLLLHHVLLHHVLLRHVLFLLFLPLLFVLHHVLLVLHHSLHYVLHHLLLRLLLLLLLPIPLSFLFFEWNQWHRQPRWAPQVPGVRVITPLTTYLIHLSWKEEINVSRFVYVRWKS